MKYLGKNQTKKALDKLQNRFLRGEKLAIPDMISEFFNAKTVIQHIYAEKKVRSWMNLMKKRLLDLDCPFGNVDELTYGIIRDEQEASYAIQKAYKRVKGMVLNQARLNKTLNVRGLLVGKTTSEKLLLSKVSL